MTRRTVPPVTTAVANDWDRVKAHVANYLTPDAFHRWVDGTTLISKDGPVLRVAVPDAATKEWFTHEEAPRIQQALAAVGVTGVMYEVRSSPPSVSRSQFAEAVSSLNPRFSFESFVVGSCNQFAHAGAMAVATAPSRSYNPLFIYGGVGLGKTHLLHAIGRWILEHHAPLRVAYTSSERFMNELIQCISTQRMSQFHEHYRIADVLLVDDIQILGGKERTQEEFFHTFNELYHHQRQIVISSDSSPKEIPGLVERLRSRFEWGLMVDLQPPDLETKLAILNKKIEAEDVTIPEDVRIFLAVKVKANIRELEGALVKLIAYSSVAGVPISLTMARHVLRHLFSPQERRVSIDAIIRAVGERFGLQPSELKQRTNARQIAYPRQIALYLAKELTTASSPEIGRAFGGKSHVTVLQSAQKIEKLRHADPDLNRLLHSIINQIGQ